MGKTHDLKAWPEPFQAVLEGRKRYEIRVDDREFSVGDLLRLREWMPGFAMLLGDGKYTGREITVRVTYKTGDRQWGLPELLCVLSIVPVDGSQIGATYP